MAEFMIVGQWYTDGGTIIKVYPDGHQKIVLEANASQSRAQGESADLKDIILFAYHYGGGEENVNVFFVSNDYGETFNICEDVALNAILATTYNCDILHLDGKFYVIAIDSGYDGGYIPTIWTSEDGGNTWTQTITSGLPVIGGWDEPKLFCPDGETIYFSDTSMSSSETRFITVWYSTDLGLTWTAIDDTSYADGVWQFTLLDMANVSGTNVMLCSGNVVDAGSQTDIYTHAPATNTLTAKHNTGGTNLYNFGFEHDDILYAFNDDEHWLDYSTDLGISWLTMPGYMDTYPNTDIRNDSNFHRWIYQFPSGDKMGMKCKNTNFLFTTNEDRIIKSVKIPYTDYNTFEYIEMDNLDDVYYLSATPDFSFIPVLEGNQEMILTTKMNTYDDIPLYVLYEDSTHANIINWPVAYATHVIAHSPDFRHIAIQYAQDTSDLRPKIVLSNDYGRTWNLLEDSIINSYFANEIGGIYNQSLSWCEIEECFWFIYFGGVGNTHIFKGIRFDETWKRWDIISDYDLWFSEVWDTYHLNGYAYIVSSYESTGERKTTLTYSSDGITWLKIDDTNYNDWEAQEKNNAKMVRVNDTNIIITPYEAETYTHDPLTNTLTLINAFGFYNFTWAGAKDNIIYVYDYKKVYMSTDTGVSFTEITSDLNTMSYINNPPGWSKQITQNNNGFFAMFFYSSWALLNLPVGTVWWSPDMISWTKISDYYIDPGFVWNNMYSINVSPNFKPQNNKSLNAIVNDNEIAIIDHNLTSHDYTQHSSSLTDGQLVCDRYMFIIDGTTDDDTTDIKLKVYDDNVLIKEIVLVLHDDIFITDNVSTNTPIIKLASSKISRNGQFFMLEFEVFEYDSTKTYDEIGWNAYPDSPYTHFFYCFGVSESGITSGSPAIPGEELEKEFTIPLYPNWTPYEDALDDSIQYFERVVTTKTISASLNTTKVEAGVEYQHEQMIDKFETESTCTPFELTENDPKVVTIQEKIITKKEPRLKPIDTSGLCSCTEEE